MKYFQTFSIKKLAIAVTIVPLAIFCISPSILAADRSSKKAGKSESNTPPATKQDTFLYRQIGINFLCRARVAKVEFPKALGIASATFADIIAQKHSGFVEEVPDKQLEPKQLYLSGEIQILEGALKFCPDQVPKDAKKKFEEFLKKEKK